jgi:hypothetical protein
MTMRGRFGLWLGGLMLVGFLGLGGYLQDEASMFVRYDAGADRFSMLTVYEHFRSSGPVGNQENLATDAKALVRLWAARDRMIPVEPSIFGTPNCLELSEDHRSLVDAEKDVEAAGIGWETIEIIPARCSRMPMGRWGFIRKCGCRGRWWTRGLDWLRRGLRDARGGQGDGRFRRRR